MLVIAKRRDGGLLVIVAEKSSTIEKQIRWLFGLLDIEHPGFSVKSELETEQDSKVDPIVKTIFQSI